MTSQIDNVLIQVRALLQARGIKLWMEPYYLAEIGCCEIELENLATDFSTTLDISFTYCLTAVKELQSSALDKLRAREEFQKTGVATVKVKVVSQHSNGRTISLSVRLTDTGNDLREKIAQEIQVDSTKLKVICSGKVLQLQYILSEQGVTNNQQIMALVMDQDAGNTNTEIYDRVRKAREDASILLESKNQSFLRMEDQDGNAVHLPPNERKMILMALALHEKGRSAMKREQYNEALILFLEADEEFSSCNAKILESVDNYALLNLDIVWCYLCLKSITHLPDAQRRLSICADNFRRSYGTNMDRVIALKGGSENERALIMRLHLLQGVMLFHQNRRNEAKNKLLLAESELRILKVDEMAVIQLMEMGYTPAEARIGLRACSGNVEEAVPYIIERRLKKSEARRRAKDERKFDNNSMKDESWVNPRTAHTLVQMGFPKDLVFAALRKADNDLYQAIDFLNNRRDELANEKPTDILVDQDMINKVVKMGFNPEMAKIALELALNNSERAVDILLKMQNDGNIGGLLNTIQSAITNTNVTNDPPTPSTSGNVQTEPFTNEVHEIKERLKNEVEAMQAYDRFAQDIAVEDDEYLDLTLDQEEKTLLQYKRFLN